MGSGHTIRGLPNTGLPRLQACPVIEAAPPHSARMALLNKKKPRRKQRRCLGPGFLVHITDVSAKYQRGIRSEIQWAGRYNSPCGDRVTMRGILRDNEVAEGGLPLLR